MSGDMLRFMLDAGICTRDIQILPGETCGLYLIRLTGGERSFFLLARAIRGAENGR